MMILDIWCPKCGKNDRHSRIEKDGFYTCGDCTTPIVNIAEKDCCVACGKYAQGKFQCENCYQLVCGRHIEKRNVYGFAIWGCPTCFAMSIPKTECTKDIIFGDYTGFRFVFNKEKGYYEWDKDLSLCVFERKVIPLRKGTAARLKVELERYKKENGKGEYKEIQRWFKKDDHKIDIDKVAQYIEEQENLK